MRYITLAILLFAGLTGTARTEAPGPETERGRHLHPEAYGNSREGGIGHALLETAKEP